jgi:hypothetical protein
MESFEKVAAVAEANDNRAKRGGARKNLGAQDGRSATRVYRKEQARPERLEGLTEHPQGETSSGKQRPATRAGQSSSVVAGAGFEPATSGL